jgi:hypothetical protein
VQGTIVGGLGLGMLLTVFLFVSATPKPGSPQGWKFAVWLVVLGFVAGFSIVIDRGAGLMKDQLRGRPPSRHQLRVSGLVAAGFVVVPATALFLLGAMPLAALPWVAGACLLAVAVATHHPP